MGSTYALFFKALLFTEVCTALAVYEPVREYAGSGFFSEWDYYGNIDDTTWGNVSYVDRESGTREKLTFVDPMTGHAIIRVDNTTKIEAGSSSAYRNSAKITSKDAYPIGSLIIIDAIHIPYGCSVWPAFWTLGTELGWPHAGEVDLIEGINGMTANNMVMHTDPGCVQSPGVDQGGNTFVTDCSSDVGCKVEETKPNSYGEGFAKAGGGVFALKIDVEGVFMWFWSRRDIPGSITQALPHSSMDISDWGKPSAAYPASGCDIKKFFRSQKLILDITLCRRWAGIPEVYAETCPGECISNVLGDGSNYATAYWEISYIRTFLRKGQESGSSARNCQVANSQNNCSSSGNHGPVIFDPTTTIHHMLESESLVMPTSTSSVTVDFGSHIQHSTSSRIATTPPFTFSFSPFNPSSISPSNDPAWTKESTTATTSENGIGTDTVPTIDHTSSLISALVVVDSTLVETTSTVNTSDACHGTNSVSITTPSSPRASGVTVEVTSTMDGTSRLLPTSSSSASPLLDIVPTVGIHCCVLVSLLLLFG